MVLPRCACDEGDEVWLWLVNGGLPLAPALDPKATGVDAERDGGGGGGNFTVGLTGLFPCGCGAVVGDDETRVLYHWIVVW